MSNQENKFYSYVLTNGEECFRAVFENSLVGIAITNPEGKLVRTNTALQNMLGYTSDELHNSFSHITHPDDVEKNIKLFREMVDGKQDHYRMEKRYYRKDGSIMWTNLSASAIRDRSNKFKYNVSMVEDITECKKVKNSLEEKFRLIFENAKDAIFWADPGSSLIINCNKAAEHLLERNKGEIIGMPYSDLHPPQKAEYYSRMFKENKGAVDDEAEVITKTGKVIPVHITASITAIDEQQIIQGTFHNISEQKNIEKKLEHARDEWEQTFDAIPDLITVLDSKYRIVKANQALAKKLGISRQALIGEFCYHMVHDSDSPPLYCPHNKTVATGKEYVTEIFNEKMNAYYILSTTPILDSQGLISGTVEVAREITERKLMEERLQTAAVTDDLTGVFNRRGFFAQADQQCKLANRLNRLMSLLYLDIDDFKTINDEFGHKAGDQVLIDTADILKSTFRASDIVGRIGGDEFAVLFIEPPSTDVDKVVIKHLASRLKNYNTTSGHSSKLSFSTGMAHYNPDSPCSLDDLLIRADAIMYENKKNYKAGEPLNHTNNSGVIRREYERLRPDDCFSAKLSIIESAMIKNISLSGLCLISSHKIQKQKTHKILLPITDNKELSLEGNVLWSHLSGTKTEKDRHLSCYEAGISFININKHKKQLLEKLIKTMTS